MSTSERQQRLAHELRRLQVLAGDSTIFRFEAEGQWPNHYRVILQGESSCPDYLNEHEIDIWLNAAFPNEPPSICFVATLFHPNVARSGKVDLAKCGMPWESSLTLDRICERLWDVARLSYLDFENTANDAAREWFHTQREMSLPVDFRRLRNAREISWGTVRQPIQPGKKGQPDILFINDESPTPQLPASQLPASQLPASRPREDDDDVLYIDDE